MGDGKRGRNHRSASASGVTLPSAASRRQANARAILRSVPRVAVLHRPKLFPLSRSLCAHRPMTESDNKRLLAFLEPQIRDYGGNVEIDTGLWSLFVVPATDSLANATARLLLKSAPFAHETGPSADDRWTIYYVNDAN